MNEIENFEYLLLSPGPGIPDESGLLKKTIKFYAKTKYILGVCLGQQAICEVFGGQLVNFPVYWCFSKIKIIEIGSQFSIKSSFI